MITGIDHLVVAVPDLDRAAEAVRSVVGLSVAPGGLHPDHGTANRLVWLGDTYLELVAVVDPERARGSWFGRLVLERVEDGGGLAALCLASDDLDADLIAARARGALVEGPVAGERRRADGRVVRWRLAVPDPLGSEWAPFLIEHDSTAAEWTPGERAERATFGHPIGGRVRLALLEIPVGDVSTVTGRYLRTWGILFRPSLAGGGARDANVGEQVIRLRRRSASEGREPLVELVRLGAEGDGSSGGPLSLGDVGEASGGGRLVLPFGLRFRWRSPRSS